jgi:hypothetical protein
VNEHLAVVEKGADRVMFDGVKDAVSVGSVLDQIGVVEKREGARDGGEGPVDSVGQMGGRERGDKEFAENLEAEGIAEDFEHGSGAIRRFCHV